MAAEIDHHLQDHQAFFESTSRFCPELSFDRQQMEYESGSSVSISVILDQGSISFGKYATEVLAWEKRSVFPQDRYQEELENFKNPGSVAQKKAYFEEYYKKLRAMKGLQAEQQETSMLEACPNSQKSTTQEQDNVNSTVPVADKYIVSNLNLSSSDCSVCDLKQATEARSESTKTTLKKSPFPSVVNHKANQPKKQLHSLHVKGNVASIRNKTMLESCRTMKNTSKESEKPKPTIGKVIQKNGNSLLPSKKSVPKAASKIKRQIMEGCPTATVPYSLLAKGKQESSLSSGGACLVKPITTSQGLGGELPTRMQFNAQATKPLSSSSIIRTHQTKLSTTCKGLAVKLPTSSSVQVQSAKPVSSTSSKRTPQENPKTTSKGLAGRLPTRSLVKVQCAKPVPSTSSMKIHPEKPTASSEGLAEKLLSRSSVHVPCAKPVSSSSGMITRPVLRSTTPQNLVKKLPTTLPVNSESSKSSSKDKTSPGGLRSLVKRYPNLSSLSKSSQNIGTHLGQGSLVQEGKKKEVKEELVAELIRDQRAASSSGPRTDLKQASSMALNNSRTLRENPAPMISLQQSMDEKHGQINTATKSVCRQIKPIWR